MVGITIDSVEGNPILEVLAEVEQQIPELGLGDVLAFGFGGSLYFVFGGVECVF